MNLKEQLLKGSISSIFIRIFGTGLSFLLSVFLARTLGAEGFGIYSFVLSLIIFSSIPIQAGLPNLVVRETAKAHLNNDWSIIKGLLYWVGKLILFYLSLIIFIYSFIYIFDFNFLNKERFEVFKIAFVLIVLLPILLIQNANIRGLGRVLLGIIPDVILRPGLTLIFLGIFFLLFKKDLTPFFVIIIYVISVFISVLISFIFIWNSIPRKERNKSIKVELQKWKKAAYPLTIVGGLQLMYSYIDIIILGFFHSDVDVGVYRAVGQLGTLVVFGLTAINQMLHSYFAKLYSSNDIEKLQKIVTYSSFLIFLVALVPSIIFIFVGEYILRLVFGEEFVIGFLPLIILTLGQLANATFGSVSALLNMTGHEKDAMRGMFYSLGINLLLGFILIPMYGMIGAAISTATSLIIWNVILRYYVKKRLQIESIGFIQIIRERGL